MTGGVIHIRHIGRSAALAAAALLVLSGCTNELSGRFRNGGRPAFDGQYFRAKLSVSDENPAAFSVSVRDPGKTLKGAREAGRYEGVDYCITHYGDSAIDWTAGPDADAASLSYDQDGNLLLSGACRGW